MHCRHIAGLPSAAVSASGLMGGLIGAGIGGLRLGYCFWGGGLRECSGGSLGFLLQICLYVVLGRFLFRRFTGGRRPAFAGGPSSFARSARLWLVSFQATGGSGRTAADHDRPGDDQQFEQLLQGIQAAWNEA